MQKAYHIQKYTLASNAKKSVSGDAQGLQNYLLLTNATFAEISSEGATTSLGVQFWLLLY